MVLPNLSDTTMLLSATGLAQINRLASTAPLSSRTFPLLAHEGGWDEVLLVAVPLSVIGGLLWIANRRVNAQLAEAVQTDADADAPTATQSAEAADANEDETPDPTS